MKTLGVNPFNLRPTLKRVFTKPKAVEIPADLPDEIYKPLAKLQNSLDYMATNYGIKFTFHHSNTPNQIYVFCKKNNIEAFSQNLREEDKTSEMARKIYEAASEVL